MLRHRRHWACVLLGLVFALAGCGGGGAAAHPAANQTEAAAATSSLPARNETSATSVSAPASATSSTPSTPAATSTPGEVTVVDAGQAAVQMVRQVYAATHRAGAPLQFAFDHASVVQGHTVYTVHVFQTVNNHTSTVQWVDVRDDGLLRDSIQQGAWMSAQQFHPVS
ncbi:MAG: hypothetical protein K6T31_02050 [Alicyclobacillus sp.]|nr:hypothetical protein [Alicyclobacillus sp.]